MAQKNSEVWLRFLESEIGTGPTPIVVSTEALTETTFLHRIECPGDTAAQPTASLVFATAQVDEGPESLEIRSGDPSQSLIELEATLRALRQKFPALPLLVLFKPDHYQRRCHAWMVGEFLAERDLILWADLRHLHPARMADWARSLADCGLASPRAVFQVTERLHAVDLPALTGTGVWLVGPEMGNNLERLRMEQV